MSTPRYSLSTLRILVDHSPDTQNEHSRLLGEHSQMLGEQSRLLGEHSEAIRSMIGTLNEHTRILLEHSVDIEFIKSMLQNPPGEANA